MPQGGRKFASRKIKSLKNFLKQVIGLLWAFNSGLDGLQ